MKISIVIATYNAGKTLSRCLDSIFCQVGTDVEVLIIDGGSKDNTLSIVSLYSSKIAFWLSERDKGIYDAWNKALAHTKGEWIMFLGADDYLLPNAIQVYMDLLNNDDLRNVDIISGRYEYVDKNGKLLGVNGSAYNYNVFKKYMNISHGSTLHNKRLFEELGQFNLKYRICADYEFLLRRQLNGRFVDKPMICMQTGGMSCSIKALNETFLIRKEKNSVSLIVNCFLYIKGLLGLYYKKLCAQFRGL